MAISNNSTGLRPGVCTSTTRPTAPYEGQHIYETDTDIEYVWNGSAWVVNYVSAASPAFTGVPTAPTATAGTNTTQLATTAFANTAGGLVYVTSYSIGSGVSTFIVPSAFHSTYDNYLVRLDAVTFSAANDSIFAQLRTGTSTSATNYIYSLPYATYIGGTSNAASTTGVSFNNIGRSLGAGDKASTEFRINQPYLAAKTTANGFVIGSDLQGLFGGYHNSATSYDQLVVSVSGTMTGGTCTIYGYRKP